MSLVNIIGKIVVMYVSRYLTSLHKPHRLLYLCPWVFDGFTILSIKKTNNVSDIHCDPCYKIDIFINYSLNLTKTNVYNGDKKMFSLNTKDNLLFQKW